MTALQPLTDAQVNNRLEADNAGGSLERDIRARWSHAGDIIESGCASSSATSGAPRARHQLYSQVDADWIQGVAEYGRRLYGEKLGSSIHRKTRTT